MSKDLPSGLQLGVAAVLYTGIHGREAAPAPRPHRLRDTTMAAMPAAGAVRLAPDEAPVLHSELPVGVPRELGLQLCPSGLGLKSGVLVPVPLGELGGAAHAVDVHLQIEKSD